MNYLISTTWDATADAIDEALDYLARQGDCMAAEMLGARDASRPFTSLDRVGFESFKSGEAYRKGRRWVEDKFRSKAMLQETHGDEHPDYPQRDWVAAVTCDNTLLGYWDWVHAQIEETR
jgi:hypothetical protein